jgi:predicted ATP-grasp superfamily ATP-dependent carboligase
MHDNKKIRVLLLEGFARQSMAMMEALHRNGYHVTTYNGRKTDLGYLSRYPDKKILAFWDRSNEAKSADALLEILKADHYDVTIPLTDFSATLLSRRKADFGQYTHPAVNDWPVFIQAADKQNTMNACMDNGIPCPVTLRDAHSVDEVLASGLPYPFIVKPRVGYGSIGFHVIHDRQELEKHLPACLEQFGPMLIQEYIPQTDKQYKCEVFIDGKGDVKSAHVFDKTRWYPIDGGSTCCSTSVQRPDIVESSVRLLQAIGWRGYGDVDLIQDPRDHVAKVMEINPRITASVKLCIYSGVDFARQIVEDAIGREVTPFMSYETGVCLRYMHTDLLWFLESPDRFRARPSWFSWRHTTDQIWNPRDPLPWFGYTLQAFLKCKAERKKRKR